ncbi:MAG: hypothetical protein WAV53_05685, partial [Anaerolineae bacterium]
LERGRLEHEGEHEERERLDHEGAKWHEGREARRARRDAPRRASSRPSRFVFFANLRGFVIQTLS